MAKYSLDDWLNIQEPDPIKWRFWEKEKPGDVGGGGPFTPPFMPPPPPTSPPSNTSYYKVRKGGGEDIPNWYGYRNWDRGYDTNTDPDSYPITNSGGDIQPPANGGEMGDSELFAQLQQWLADNANLYPWNFYKFLNRWNGGE